MKMLKHISYLGLLLGFLCWSFTYPPASDDIVGQWYTDGNESIIKIYKKGAVYYGNIHWVEEPYDENGQLKRDDKNPQEDKRNDLITEVVLLHHFKFNGEDTWEDGIIYNPEDGKDYHGVITLKDRNTLSLRGYIGLPIFGKSVLWKRKL